MTYEELYNQVAAHLPPDMSFCLEVETWRHEGKPPETRWSIYVASSGPDREWYEGPTCLHVWMAFEAKRCAPTLAEVSVSVGEAIVAPELYKCCSPHCPGYPFKASEIAHPPSTCHERDDPN